MPFKNKADRAAYMRRYRASPRQVTIAAGDDEKRMTLAEYLSFRQRVYARNKRGLRKNPRAGDGWEIGEYKNGKHSLDDLPRLGRRKARSWTPDAVYRFPIFRPVKLPNGRLK